MQVEEREREREREKAYLLKEDLDASVASKKRKLKREHPQAEAGEYLPPGPPPLTINLSQPYDGRERERKSAMPQRPGYIEEPGLRVHGKETINKMTRRDAEQYP